MYHWIIENLIDPNLEKYLATGEMGDYNYEYLLNYTNASYLLDPEFDFDPEPAFTPVGTRRPRRTPTILGIIRPRRKRTGHLRFGRLRLG